jgi:hypothetical protein
MSTLRSEADVLRFVAGFQRKDEMPTFRAVVEECEKVARVFVSKADCVNNAL